MHARSVRSLALLLCLLPSPPARASDDFKCEARGGRPWREVTTEHFVVATDLRASAATELAEELETMHHAVQYALFTKPPPMPGRLRVIAFDDDDEFERFAPKNAAAYYSPSPQEGPIMVMRSHFAEETRYVVAHELAHHVLARVLARQPAWFAEGMACYLESVGANGPDATPTVGGMSKRWHRAVYPYMGGVSKVLRARGLISSDQEASEKEYGTAWALVHFLINTRSKEFFDLMGRFQRAQEPDAAWLEVFPQWNPGDAKAMADLDDQLGKYLAHGSFGYRTIQLDKDHPVAQRAMSASQVHDLRLSIPRREDSMAAMEKSLAAEAAEALSEDPANVGALRVQAAHDKARASALAEMAVKGHPEDYRAWLFRGGTTEVPAAREADYRKALELAPESETALNELAWLLVSTEREGEALPLAKKAAFLAPWSAPTLDTLAAALQGLGRCQDALAIQRRAVDVLTEQASAETRKRYTDRVDALAAKCGAPAPAPAAAPPAKKP